MKTIFTRRRFWAFLFALVLLGITGVTAQAATAATTPAPTPAVTSEKLAALQSGNLTLRVGTDATFPPFEFTDANGDKMGFDIDLVRALAKQTGIKNVQFIQMPFGNIVPALQANQIDVGASAIYISAERAKAVDFSDVYYPGGLSIFVSDKNTNVKSLADLAGKKVAVQVGTKSVEWLSQNQPKAQLVQVQTNDQMFSSVKLGQADAVVTGQPGGRYFIVQQGGLKQVGERLTNENYGYAFQKPDTAIKDSFNSALSDLKANGGYDKLTAKWFGHVATAAPVSAKAHGLINISSITNSAVPLWNGFVTTMEIIGMSLVLSLCFGMLGGFAKLSKITPIRWLGTAYVSVIRGTPFIVQLFLIYFGLPQLGLQLQPLVAGVFALGLYSGSYVTEIVRGAIQSVDKGQMEAARSCGMSSGSALRHIIVPQAFLRMLPPLGNEFVSLTKNSALVSFVTISELFLVGQTIISRTFDALTVYIFIGLVYYVITNIIGFIANTLEKKMAVYL
ncbi:ABC transporter substrate-binding protein/permease [Arthrobacter sp. H14-L1]|uniref:ABC transporter substrate-binding protein/permease n=1 Tax=Arthrobacter sp. H14-L1 TaxID=2996697 RepID=UPI002271BCA1|nr:ABC transporter substrate-binding protein/permease [Arthrobacter sp. H14-L1]MCY0905988.1 ABC transporter substrate-binding protein/permease [Arthrobacter sp. H14-L1]